MNATTALPSTPQLGFDFNLHIPPSAAVNKCGSTSVYEFDLSNPTGIAAGEALSRMIVDDRVLFLGMTNWRALLDRAITSGHTELYPSEDGRQGLRKPGFRFGPITRMPEQGHEYVKRAVLALKLQKALSAGVALKSVRITVWETIKLDLVARASGILIVVYEGRKAAASLELAFADLPFTTGSPASDVNAQTEFFAMRLAAVYPTVEPGRLAEAASAAFAQVTKVLDGPR